MHDMTGLTEALQAKYADMPINSLNIAVRDIQGTLQIWRDEPLHAEYCKKLWQEFDIATARRQAILKGVPEKRDSITHR